MDDTVRQRRRVGELDAVRGLAALAVVLGHLALTLPAVDEATRSHGLTPLNALLYSPLYAVLDGSAAVVVFFVLSGYVLTLSYEGGRQTYAGFLVRRVARLWLPYMIAVAAAMLLASALGDSLVGSASHWFNARWQGSLGVGVILQHLSLIGHYNNNAQYVPVIWSLTDEMRISLVFPLLLAGVAFLGWRWSVAVAVLLVAVGLELSYKVTGDLATLEYVACFIVGALLATRHEAIAARLARTTAAQRRTLVVAAVLLYTWAAWVPPSLLPHPLAKLATSQATIVLLETAAAALFIAIARYPGRARRLLLSAVPQYLGRISYSLYLLHTVVLLTVIHVVDPSNVGLILALYPLVLILSIGLADLSQRWVELPAQRLGRRLAARVEHREQHGPAELSGPERPAGLVEGPGAAPAHRVIV